MGLLARDMRRRQRVESDLADALALANETPTDAIISMAQQASPKVAGHNEFLRAQLTTLFIETVRNG